MTPGDLDALDPALPGLAGCLSTSAVAALFERHWPRGAVACGQLLEVRRHDVRYEPGRGCATAWRMLVEPGDGPPVTTIGVVEVDGHARRHRLYQDDPALPGLPVASDGAAMATRLGDALGVELDACVSWPVRYRPGQRAVLAYDLAAGGRRFRVYGKLVTGGAQQLAATLDSLHLAAKRVLGMPGVPAPLAVLADLGLVILAEAPGRSLRSLLSGPEATPAGGREALRRAGRALAGLHSCGVAAPSRVSMEEDISALRVGLADVARADPALAERMEAVLDRLSAPAPAGSAARPSHGSFRPDHLFIAGGGTTLIDLDGFSASEAGRDAGNLLAYLRWKAIREPARASVSAAAPGALLEGYRSSGGDVDPPRWRVHEAASMLRISIRRFRNLAVHEWPLIPRLVDAAEDAVRAAGAPMVRA